MTDRATFERHFQLTLREQGQHKNGEYQYPHIQAKWEGWQAREQLAAPETMDEWACKEGNADRIEQQAKRIAELETSLQAIIDELDEDDGQAPGHCHRVKGLWDDSGAPCELCETWSAAKALLRP